MPIVSTLAYNSLTLVYPLLRGTKLCLAPYINERKGSTYDCRLQNDGLFWMLWALLWTFEGMYSTLFTIHWWWWFVKMCCVIPLLHYNGALTLYQFFFEKSFEEAEPELDEFLATKNREVQEQMMTQGKEVVKGVGRVAVTQVKRLYTENDRIREWVQPVMGTGMVFTAMASPAISSGVARVVTTFESVSSTIRSKSAPAPLANTLPPASPRSDREEICRDIDDTLETAEQTVFEECCEGAEPSDNEIDESELQEANDGSEAPEAPEALEVSTPCEGDGAELQTPLPHEGEEDSKWEIVENEEKGGKKRVQCPHCGKYFKKQGLHRHEGACKKAKQKATAMLDDV